MPQSKPYIIGLTGGIASGKSTVSAILQDMGLTIVDADAISRALTAPGGKGLPPIRRRFGAKCFDAENRLDRGRLGEIIFADETARRDLEGILHPLILKEMREQTAAAAQSGAERVVWDVPLLFESGMDALCDETWLVIAPEGAQLARLMARDGLTREQALRRIASQMPLAEKQRRAGRWIRNQGSLTELREQVERLVRAMEK